ncbi:MAG TPA: phosphoribosyltransferase [Candidatus Paceibacterota bacterium]
MAYLPSLIRAVQDALSDQRRQRVTESGVAECCRTLVGKVLEWDTPDLVIAIATGGTSPGNLMAEAMGIPVVHLHISRDIKIKRRYSLDPIPLRWILSAYHHFLFQTTMPKVLSDTEIDVSGKKVLIVDDSVHTGKTIDVAVRYVEGKHASEIKVATLARVSERCPDFFVLPPGNYSFPWSKDYV